MMATFTSVDAFADHVADYGKKLQQKTPVAVRKVTAEAADIIRNEGSRFRIRGRGPLGANVGLNSVTAQPANSWMLVEKGAKRHRIQAHGRLLRTPYGAFPRVNHPGTHGSLGKPWEAAMRRVESKGPDVFEREILSVFKG